MGSRHPLSPCLDESFILIHEVDASSCIFVSSVHIQSSNRSFEISVQNSPKYTIIKLWNA